METGHTSVVRYDTNTQHFELPMNYISTINYKIIYNDNTVCNIPYYSLLVVGLQMERRQVI